MKVNDHNEKLKPARLLPAPRAFKQLPTAFITMTSGSVVLVRVLIINPNTSQHMTNALKPVTESLGFENVSLYRH